MNLLNLIFGCAHDWSRIWTIRPLIRRAARDWPEVRGAARSYQTCLVCGAERERDWKAIGRIEESEQVGREAEQL